MENRIGIGRTAEIYPYANDRILKLYFKDIPHTLIREEYENNRIISKMDIPTAKCCDLIEVEGRKGLILQRIAGISMMEIMEKRPFESMKYANELAAIHYSIQKETDAKLKNNKEQLIERIRNVAVYPINKKRRFTNI